MGLTAAGIIENRDLFPDVRFGEMADQMSNIYESEGLQWGLNDRALFLEALGRLDPSGGDPRVKSDRWISQAQLSIELGRKKDVFKFDNDLRWAWAPVTVHEFRKFVDSSAFRDDELWKEFPPLARKLRDTTLSRLRVQYRHPNRPVGRVNVFEAIAYCRWKTRVRTDGKIVRLARHSEIHPILTRVVKLISPPDFEDEELSARRGGFGFSHPVGIFRSPCSLTDLLGNGWSWAFRDPTAKIEKNESVYFGVYGGYQHKDFVEMIPGEFEYVGYPTIGFRCVLSDKDVDLTKNHFAQQPKYPDVVLNMTE